MTARPLPSDPAEPPRRPGPPGAAPQASPWSDAPPPQPPRDDLSPLAESEVLRPRADRPRTGWRRTLFELTGGRVNPGPGSGEVRREELLGRIRTPLPGAHRVAVTSVKGGVGKTTVSACLGLTLAEHRGDRAIVLDANPDAGTLADRLTGDARVTVRELLDDLDDVATWTDVSRYTSLAGRLQVLASEQDPASGDAFRRDEYEAVSDLLGRFFNIIVTDSGTGLVHSAMEGTLARADSVVVVGAPTVDGAGRAAKTLDWLVAHGHAGLARDAVVVLSCDRRSAEVDVSRIRDHFRSRVRTVVEIPHDPHLATGGRIDPARLRPATSDAFLELAAAVADDFAGR
ncbi:MinD/ParA family ATP-binding protein [Pseudonocardia phyllosphaerae]|uniref:MinD/ParA family ATP-binding protein n=1 Tax=Pseudonocardia phyllosphaerae TaxID=3390502 RepID=UPI00397BFDF2